jgi:hypothetical protein
VRFDEMSRNNGSEVRRVHWARVHKVQRSAECALWCISKSMAIRCTGCIGCTRCTKVHCFESYALLCTKKIMAFKYIGCTGRTGCTKCTDLQSVHSGAFSKNNGCKVRRVHWVHRMHRSALICEVCTLMHHLESVAPKYIGRTRCTGCTKHTQLQAVHSGVFSKKVCIWCTGCTGCT